MPRAGLRALTRQKLSIDFLTLRDACPKGVYVTPVGDEPLFWKGIVFVRKGPYANAVLRFQIVFPDDYPARPPIVNFLSDVFHPLVAPLTTYTYAARDRITEGVSAADEERLPPGGLILRHGFPEWYDEGEGLGSSARTETIGTLASEADSHAAVDDGKTAIKNGDVLSPSEVAASNATPTVQVTEAGPRCLPHIIEVLQYMRIIFDTEVVIDSVPLNLAANPGAWHAWRSHRAKLLESRQTSAVDSRVDRERSMSPAKPQPGGARRPGEWNWAGVWEDRVKKAVRASLSEATLYGLDGHDEIEFTKLNDDVYSSLPPFATVAGEPIM